MHDLFKKIYNGHSVWEWTVPESVIGDYRKHITRIGH